MVYSLLSKERKQSFLYCYFFLKKSSLKKPPLSLFINASHYFLIVERVNLKLASPENNSLLELRNCNMKVQFENVLREIILDRKK